MNCVQIDEDVYNKPDEPSFRTIICTTEMEEIAQANGFILGK